MVVVLLLFFFKTNRLKSFKSEINLEIEKGQIFYAIKNVPWQNPVWSNKGRARSCSHFFLCPHLSLYPFFSPASPSVLHLSFHLCPSSPLLFITSLIKPAHPERTDSGGGWGRERKRQGKRGTGREGRNGEEGMERRTEGG